MTPDFWHRQLVLLGNTLAVSGLTALLAGGVGLGIAVMLFHYRVRGERLYRGLLAAALLIPMHIVVTAWYALRPDLLFLLPPAIGSALLMTPAYIPLMAWIGALGLSMADRDREEAALLDGGALRVLRAVTLPEVRPILLGGVLVVFILSAGEVTATDVLRVRTFAEEIFTQFQLRQPAQAAGVAVVLAALTIGLSVVAALTMRQLGEISADGLARRFDRPPSASRGPLSLLVPAGIFLLLLGAPLAALVMAVESPANLARSATVVWQEMIYTFCVAGSAAVVCALAATVAGWAVSQSKWRKGWTLLLVGLALLPAPIVGYAAIVCFDRPGLLGAIYDSPAIVAVVLVVRFLPLAALIAVAFALRMPSGLREASRLDGAGRLHHLARIVLPISWPAGAILALIVFALSIGEVGATALVAPPGTTMLSVRIFTLLHYGVYYDVAGAALLLAIPMAFLGWLVFRLGGRYLR